MRTLRNIFRRKVRAALTILGIVIGVFALVVMGAMAEKLTLLVDGGTKYFQDKVNVSAKNSMNGFISKPLSVDLIKDVEKVRGVARAQGEVVMMLDEEPSAVSMGPPAQITGSDLRGRKFETFKVDFADGRDLRPGENGTVIVGADLINKLKADVGKKIRIRGKSFIVVGILDKTLTGPDTMVGMSLADAQKLYHADMPEMVRTSIKPAELVTNVTATRSRAPTPIKWRSGSLKKLKMSTPWGRKRSNARLDNRSACSLPLLR